MTSANRFSHRLQLLGAVLLLPLVIASTNTCIAQENSLAQELLARMSQSLRELNYQGKFTFEVADNAIETYEIKHWVDESGEKEVLSRLNGPAKVVKKENATLDCLAMGDKILRGSLGNIHPSDQLFSNYSLYLRGEQRVANRTVYLLHLVPHDVYRNGQTIAIDKTTFLPLQRQWFSPDNKLLERLQFVEIELDPIVANSDDAPVTSSPSTSTSTPVLTVEDSPCESVEPPPGRISWSVNWLPKGFFLTRIGGTTEGESMLSYTDGLASFSVFVGERPVTVVIEGKSDRGATVAYVGNRLWQQRPYRVTVIGEIPLITAQKVVASMALIDQ